MYKLRHVLLAALLVCWVSAVGQAQIFKQVPANAVIVVKFSKLEVTSKKIADFATTLGLAQMQPAFADPLTAVETQHGITAGVNGTGDGALIFVDPSDDAPAPNKIGITVSSNSMIVLVPVSDYKAFLGNMTDATAEGDITSGHFKNDADVAYVIHWGDYAAISEMKELLAKKPEGLVPTGATAKEVEGKDFVIYVNFNNLGPKLVANVEKGRTKLLAGLDKVLTNANDPKMTAQVKPYVAVIKVALNQALNVASGVCDQTDGVVLSANVAAKGIAITELANFKPDSYAGKMASQIKNTPVSLLTGLPDGKYMVYGGGTSDPLLTSKLLGDFLDPIMAELAKVDGPFVKPIQKIVDAMTVSSKAEAGDAFGLLVPTGQLGNDPLLQMVQIRSGNAKAIAAAAKDAIEAQQELMQAIGGPAAQSSKSTFTPAAKMVDGVSFDSIHTDFEMNPTTPQAAQMSQFLTFLYGPNGLDGLAAVVNDKTYLTSFGAGDAVISSTMKTIKANDDPLAHTDGVTTVAKELPAERVAVIYIALDQIATVALSSAKQMGIDMGIKLPDNLPPIGVTVSSAGPAVRIDTYVPASLVQAITSAGFKMAGPRRAGAAGPGLPPPPGN